MTTYINRLMARFGYVPATAQDALANPGSIPLTIEVDSTQVVAALEPLEKLASAALDAEAALARLWNIQAAMQNRLPETGVGSASGSSGSNGAMSKSVFEDEMRRHCADPHRIHPYTGSGGVSDSSVPE